MTDPRALYADTLREHLFDFCDDCSCGGWRYSSGEGSPPVITEYAAHVADVLLALKGVAVVALPEGKRNDRDGWISFGDAMTADLRPGSVGVRLGVRWVTPTEARIAAAELLAAAAEVER